MYFADSMHVDRQGRPYMVCLAGVEQRLPEMHTKVPAGSSAMPTLQFAVCADAHDIISVLQRLASVALLAAASS